MQALASVVAIDAPQASGERVASVSSSAVVARAVVTKKRRLQRAKLNV
jgi:hypothetical protein